MDQMLNNNLSVPTTVQLKNYGHKIIPLYDECVKLAINNNLQLPGRVSLTNIDQQLLKLLTDFGQAKKNSNEIDDISITIIVGMDKQVLSTEEALALLGLHNQAVKYAVLHLIEMLSPIRDLISELSHKVYGLGVTELPFPQMQEFLEWMWDDRQYVLRKKKWP